MAKQTVPGTKGFQYDFGNYTTDDNPWSILRNSQSEKTFNQTERLNQRARVFIAGYDVTQDVESFTITNNMETGMTTVLQLKNPRDRYRITRTDLESNMYAVLTEDDPKRYGNKDILPTYGLESRPFSLTKSGMNGFVYKQEMNDLFEKDAGGGADNKNLKYKDYLFKHMLFLVKWHSGIRKQEHDFIFDYKEPVIIFLQGRFSTFWYFGFTGGITSYTSSFSYGNDNSISINCASRRHFLGVKSRVLTPAIGQSLTETRNIAANNASESRRQPIQEQQSGKKLEDIVPDLFLSQTSLNESFKYPVFPINHLKNVDRSTRKRSWVDFFKQYLISGRDAYVTSGKNDTKLTSLFTDAFAGLNEIYEKLLFRSGTGLKKFVFKDKTKQFNFAMGIDTRAIYTGIDKLIDPLYYKPQPDTAAQDLASVTDRKNISDPLNSVYSAILGDNIYQVSVFTVKPYSGRNINTILEANTLRFWETDYLFGGKEETANCVWKSYKSAGVIGIHPAVHEDFVNSFHILPKIFDAVVNNRHTHSKVISAAVPASTEEIKGGAFKFADKDGITFTASKYTFANPKQAIQKINTVKNNDGLTLKDFIKKYGYEGIDEISVIGHASFNPTGGRQTAEAFTKKKIEARLTGLYRATVIAEYILSDRYKTTLKDFVSSDVAQKYTVDKDLYLYKAIGNETPFDPEFAKFRDKVKVYSAGYSIPDSQASLEANYVLGEGEDSGSGSFTEMIDDLYGSTGVASNLDSDRGGAEKQKYIDDIINLAAGKDSYNEVGNAEPNIEAIVKANATTSALQNMQKGLLSRSAKQVSSEGDSTQPQTTFDFTAYKPDESKHKSNRRVEIFIKVNGKKKDVPEVPAVEVAEGICIELADRTPYDKLKEQVYGVPTETSTKVTGLNFHRPRFIVLIPPIFMSNSSPLSLAFREFKLDQQDYGSMKDVLDSVCKTTQYIYSETPMGDVIMEPMNYDLAPWDMSSAYFGKEKFAAYSPLPDHILEDTGSSDGTFMKQSKDLKYINIYPTYISTFKKGQMKGVVTDEPGNKTGQKNIPDNINLPVVKPNSIRHPYNIDRINDGNLSYSFKGDGIYTSIIVMGSNDTKNAQSNASLTGIQEKESGTFVTMSRLLLQKSVLNRNIFKSDAVVAGQYVADGFELEQEKLEYEKQAGRISMKMRSAANTLADAIFRGKQTLFKEILVGADGKSGWFGASSSKINSDFGTTLKTLVNNVLLDFIKADVKTYNDILKKKSGTAKPTEGSTVPTEIVVKGKIDDPNLLNRIHREVSVKSPGASKPIFYEIGAKFPHGKINNKGDDVLFYDYPILTETVSPAARSTLIAKYIQKDPAPAIDKSLSKEKQDEEALKIYRSRAELKQSKINALEESCRETVQLYMLYLLSKSPAGEADLKALERVLNTYAGSPSAESEASGTGSSGAKKEVNALDKVRNSFKSLPFNYADLAKLRISGDYNPQADFINLYGYVVYNPITIPWLHTPIDCQIYAMAFFNQFYNNAFGYTVSDLPMTPEILVNRPAYFSYLNSIGLLKSITTSFTAQSSSSSTLGVSYLRRNILARSNGGYWEYPDTTDSTNSTLYKYGNSYSISDVTLEQQAEVDKLFNKEPDGEYSVFRKLGMLHESLAANATTFPYQSQKDSSAGSRLEYLLEQQLYFQELYYTKLADLEDAVRAYTSYRRLYEEERLNCNKLRAALNSVSGDVAGLQEANLEYEKQLKEATASKEAATKELATNQEKKIALEDSKASLQQQLDAGTVGPPPVPNYPLTDEGKPILAQLFLVEEELSDITITISSNESAIAVYTEIEANLQSQIAQNSKVIENKVSGTDMSEDEKRKSVSGLEGYLKKSKLELVEIVTSMNVMYMRGMEIFAAIYGVIFNNVLKFPTGQDKVSEFTGYLSFNVVYDGVFKPINVYSDDPDILVNHANLWIKPSGVPYKTQYKTQLKLSTIQAEMSKLGMNVEDPADEYKAYSNDLPITIAIYQINLEIEKIQKGPAAGDTPDQAVLDGIVAESTDLAAKTGATVSLVKQADVNKLAGPAGADRASACNFSCYYMVFELYAKKKSQKFMSIDEYRKACIANGAMSKVGYEIKDRDKMAAAAGFNGLKHSTTTDITIIPSLIDKGIPVITSINEGEHYEIIDGYTKSGDTYKYSVKDPGYQHPQKGDTNTDSKTRIMRGDSGSPSTGKYSKTRTFKRIYYFPLK